MIKNFPPEFVSALFANKQVKGPHPITVLNEQEWFTPTEMQIEDGRIYVRWSGSMWFNLESCQIRTTQGVF